MRQWLHWTDCICGELLACNILETVVWGVPAILLLQQAGTLALFLCALSFAAALVYLRFLEQLTSLCMLGSEDNYYNLCVPDCSHCKSEQEEDGRLKEEVFVLYLFSVAASRRYMAWLAYEAPLVFNKQPPVHWCSATFGTSQNLFFFIFLIPA